MLFKLDSLRIPPTRSGLSCPFQDLQLPFPIWVTLPLLPVLAWLFYLWQILQRNSLNEETLFWSTVSKVDSCSLVLLNIMASLCVVVKLVTSWSPGRRDRYKIYPSKHTPWPMLGRPHFLQFPLFPKSAIELWIQGLNVLIKSESLRSNNLSVIGFTRWGPNFQHVSLLEDMSHLK